MPEAIDLLTSRRSVKPIELSGPGPTAAELATLLTVASRVPDHGKLTPWRFILFEGDARARICLRSFKARPSARVDQGQAHPPLDLRLGDDFGAWLGSEEGARALGLSGLRLPALGDPLLKPAVEDGDIAGAEMAEHEPAPRRRAQRRIIVDDDALIAADAKPLHCGRKVLRRRQHVRSRILTVRKRIDVEEDGTRDVRSSKLVAAAASRRRHVPAGVDDAEARLAEMFGQPLG